MGVGFGAKNEGELLRQILRVCVCVKMCGIPVPSNQIQSLGNKCNLQNCQCATCFTPLWFYPLFYPLFLPC